MTAETDEPRIFTARHVGAIAGLSYRQLNVWDQVGVLPEGRSDGTGWRRFSPRELFQIMVCAEIRRRLGVPLESLRYVRDFMLRDGHNHFKAAVDLIAFSGAAVLLLTDFRGTFVMDTELEFEDMMRLGYFGGEHEEAFALVKINPIVNRMLSFLKNPIQLPLHGAARELLRRYHLELRPVTPEQQEVLDIISSGSFDRLELTLGESGQIKRIYGTQQLDSKKAEEIASLVREGAFQRVTVVQHGGEIRRVERRTPIRLKNRGRPDHSTDPQRENPERKRTSEKP